MNPKDRIAGGINDLVIDDPADFPGPIDALKTILGAAVAAKTRRAQHEALNAQVDLTVARLQAREAILAAAHAAEEAERARQFQRLVHESPAEVARLIITQEAAKQNALLEVEQAQARRRLLAQSIRPPGNRALSAPEALKLAAGGAPAAREPAVQPSITARQIEQTALRLAMKVGDLPYNQQRQQLDSELASLGRYLPRHAISEVSQRVNEILGLLT